MVRWFALVLLKEQIQAVILLAINSMTILNLPGNGKLIKAVTAVFYITLLNRLSMKHHT
jgi:uncharacterized membrane protein YgaE (UPF0421/DUF939 family)